MYQTHWGLRESPFRGCLDPKSFYQSPTHEEALARLHFLVEHGRRLGLLTGPSGSGKSLLLEVFGSQLRRHGLPVARLNLLGLEPAEMLWQLADRLTEYRYRQLEAVVLLDNADQADRQVQTQVVRLAQCDPSPETRLTLVLAGRLEGVKRLDAHLLDLAELRIDVEPWEQADTEDFVKTSLAQAGQSAALFAEPAVARLHELSHGIPRRVSQLADLALLAGAGQNLQQIDAGVVEAVYQELATVGV